MSETRRSTVLLLTATIDPGATPLLERRNPLTRLQDYLGALDAWLASGAAPHIVFCENSGYDLAPLKEIALRRGGCEVEFISYADNGSGATRGKGHAELRMIERALRTSRLLAGSDVIVKCTGRLIVSNAVPVVHAIAAAKFDVMCFLKQFLSFADSRFFAATPAFIEGYLLPRIGMIDDVANVFLEHALACATASAVASRLSWRPFPVLPCIAGISGTSGKSMTDGTLKRIARSVYHRVSTVVYRR
jgi:hypothetical protein